MKYDEDMINIWEVFLVRNGMSCKITCSDLMYVRECTVYKLYLVMTRITPMQAEIEDNT